MPETSHQSLLSNKVLLKRPDGPDQAKLSGQVFAPVVDTAGFRQTTGVFRVMRLAKEATHHLSLLTWENPMHEQAHIEGNRPAI